MKRGNWRSFVEARKFVRSLKLTSQHDWAKYAKSGKRPKDIPYDISKIYKKEWVSWGDFLGTGSIATFKIQYRSFSEARKFVHKLGLKKRDEWSVFCKSGEKPDDIPNYPAGVYKNKGWKNVGDWLGTGMIAYQNREYKSFEDARKFVRSLKLSGRKEWREYLKSGKKPDDIPSHPKGTYKKEFKGDGDWLGTGRIATFNMQFRSFTEAKKFVHTLKIKSQKEWNAYRISGEKPDDIPSAPPQTYKKEWTTWGDWFGTGRIANQNMEYLPWFKAKIEYQKLAKKHGLKTYADWVKFSRSHKLPLNLPSQPWHIYTKEKVWGKMEK